MTEEEANTKWCPFSRLSTSGRNLGFNRIATDDIDAPPMFSKALCCIGSGCMAWQFDVRFSHVDGDPSKNVYAETGHCGLVRQP